MIHNKITGDNTANFPRDTCLNRRQMLPLKIFTWIRRTCQTLFWFSLTQCWRTLLSFDINRSMFCSLSSLFDLFHSIRMSKQGAPTKFSNVANKMEQQDGRLAPAYFSPNYKYFDQLLQTVKIKTTVLIIVFQRVFTNINSTTDFCTLCKRVSRLSFEKFLSHGTESFLRGTLLCSRKLRVSKNFMPKRWISPFSIKNLLSHATEKLRRGTLLCFTNFLVSKKNYGEEGRGGVSRFSVEKFLSHSAEKFRRGTP